MKSGRNPDLCLRASEEDLPSLGGIIRKMIRIIFSTLLSQTPPGGIRHKPVVVVLRIDPDSLLDLLTRT